MCPSQQQTTQPLTSYAVKKIRDKTRLGMSVTTKVVLNDGMLVLDDNMLQVPDEIKRVLK